jgi:hypothetical protein
MKLKEIKNQKLDGWEIKPVYSMELKHGLMGYFPLVDEENKKVIVCINRNDLKSIWEKLKPKEVTVTSNNCMVNTTRKLVIPLHSDESDSDDFLLITDDISEHLENTQFDYASGLLSFKDESKCKFPES